MGSLRHATVLIFGFIVACTGLAVLWSASGHGTSPPIGVARKSMASTPERDTAESAESRDAALKPPPLQLTRRQESAPPDSPAIREEALRGPRVLRLAEWSVAGLVVGIDGQPLPGQSIRVSADAPHVQRAISDAAGAFQMVVTGRSDRIDASAPGSVTVAATRAARGAPGLVVVAPSAPFSVAVRDASTGLPLPAARVTPVASERLHTRLTETRKNLEAQGHGPLPPFASSAFFAASTNADGFADLPALPIAGWTDVVVSRPGYQDRRASLELASSRVLAIELDPVAQASTYSGQVVDTENQPVPGTLVMVAGRSTRTAGDGSFSLEAIDGESDRLDAFHPEHGIARMLMGHVSDDSLKVTLLPHGPPLHARLILDASVTASNVRVVPLNAEGEAWLSAPPWRTSQVESGEALEFPASMAGESLAVVDKNGSLLGHIVVGSGDLQVRRPGLGSERK